MVSDLDGTLLNDVGTVNPRSVQALERFVAEGGSFSVATGRIYGAAKDIFRQLPINVPVIIGNGSCILDLSTGKTLVDLYLPEQAKEYVKEISQEFPQMDLDFFPQGADWVYVEKGQNLWENVFISQGLPFQTAEPADWERRWRKCIFECPTEWKPAFDRYLFQKRDTLGGVSIVNSSALFYEMIPQKASKGAALSLLADYLSISRENIAAVGDYDNDLSMVRFAGIGAFTANAADELKKQSDLVVGSNAEGGVADLVEYLERLCKGQ